MNYHSDVELDILGSHIERAGAELSVSGQRMCATVLFNLLVDRGYWPEFTEYDGAVALRLAGSKSDAAVVIAPCYTWEHEEFDEENPAAWEATLVDGPTGEHIPMPVPESQLPYGCTTIWAHDDLGADLRAGLRFVEQTLALAHSLVGFRPDRVDVPQGTTQPA